MRKINKYILVLFNCFENFPLFILKCSPLRQSLEEIVSLNLPKPLDPLEHQQPIGVISISGKKCFTKSSKTP